MPLSKSMNDIGFAIIFFSQLMIQFISLKYTNWPQTSKIILKVLDRNFRFKSNAHLVLFKIQYLDLFLTTIIYLKTFSWVYVRLGTTSWYPSVRVCSYRSEKQLYMKKKISGDFNNISQREGLYTKMRTSLTKTFKKQTGFAILMLIMKIASPCFYI